MNTENAAVFLLGACVCIELWHIIYYMFLYEKYFKQLEKSFRWISSYEKMYNHFIEFTDYYINNIKLQYSLGINTTSKEMLLIIQLIKALGTPLECKRKILSPYSTTILLNRLVIIFVDIIYYAILFTLLWFFMPGATGVCLFSVLLTLNLLKRGIDRESGNRKYLYLLAMNSITHIAVFVIFIFGI